MIRAGKERDADALEALGRTPGRWAPLRGCVPRPGFGYPWVWAPAARGGPGGGRTTTTIERRRGGDGSRSRSAALPTTGTRLARRGAPLHAAAARPARRPRRRRIDSFTPYTIIHTVGTTDARQRARHHHVSARHVLVPLPPAARPPPRPPPRASTPTERPRASPPPLSETSKLY